MDGITNGLSISEQRLVDALREAQNEAGLDSEGALTTEQLSMITGWNVTTVRKHLKILKRRGIVQTTRVRQEDLADRIMPIYAYRIKPEALEGDNKESNTDERQ